MNQQAKNNPAIRFPEFHEDWEAVLFGDVAEFKNGLNFSSENRGKGLKIIGVVDFKDFSSIAYDSLQEVSGFENIDESYLLRESDILFVRSNGNKELIGRSLLISNVTEKITYSGFTIRARISKTEAWPGFVALSLKRNSIKARLMMEGGGTNISNLNQGLLSRLPLALPRITEQRKITTFFSLMDEKIGQLVRKGELLLKYRKGLMQQIFEQKTRFKGDSGNSFPDWQERKLSEFSTIVDRTMPTAGVTPIMTISGRRGFLTQKDRFSKVIAGESLENYIALAKGELAYNRGNSKSALYGSINVMRNEIALVPFVYHCFKLQEDVDPRFIEYSSTSDYVNRQLRRIITSTARMNGLLNISKRDFFETKFKIPCYSEQTKIVSVLAALDQKIERVKQQLERTKNFKKGLLQQMFV